MIDVFRGEHFFLSNFYPHPVHLDGEEYPTVEHAYQAAKTLSDWWRKKISQYATPNGAKAAGRKLPLRSDWLKVRVQVMRSLLWEKFNDPIIAPLLIATHPHELVEGNWWGDTFWGVYQGQGHNMLGKLIMEIRKEIIERTLKLYQDQSSGLPQV